MKYLLDTHTFLWAAFEPDKLSPKAAEACETGELWLSAASVWEIAIKVQIGRLPVPEPVRDFVTGSFEPAGSRSCRYTPATLAAQANSHCTIVIHSIGCWRSRASKKACR
ncbi:MAG: type II toxin-antitoxin system VapC family toxin [Bryobacteraceae bacterium]|jgi:PIN domain nuclease of toxin-antitoxin system